MATREQARAEDAFLRGAAGVDGAATEQDERDAQQVEQDAAREQLLRGRTWLGREFLTWLLWRSEAGEPLVELDGEGVVVLFTGKVLLRGLAGDVTELAAKGEISSLKIRDYLSTLRYEGLSGMAALSGKSEKCHEVVQVKEGKFVQLQ